MAGPSYNWLAQGAPMLTEQGVMEAPPPPPPAAAPVLSPTAQFLSTALGPGGLGQAVRDAAPPAPMGPPPPPPAPPAADVAPPPPPPPAAHHAMPVDAPAPPKAPPLGDVQFLPVGGGGMPAREVSIRGPQQEAHLMAAYDPLREAATQGDFRAQVMADREDLMYEAQAAEAMKRQEAAERVAVRRQQELQALEQDYRSAVASAGQMHIDDNRYWANKSTGDKIGTLVLVFLGGLGAMGGNGQNLAYDAVLREIDRDIEAQKFDYQVAMDRAKGANNAFALAMDRYGSEDAAQAMSRAAALDYAAAKVGQLGAQWKGAESASAADELRAMLKAEQERTIAAGLRFIPASAGQRRYMMSFRGQLAPGTFSESEAQSRFLEHGVKPVEAADQEMLKGGIALAGKGAEKEDEGAKYIANAMREADIPQMRQLAEDALAALNASEGGFLEAGVRNALPTRIGKMVLSDEANAREQLFQAFTNLQMNKLSGGAISPSEEARHKAALGDKSDPKGRRRALKAVLRSLDAAEKNIKAGASPSAQQVFEERRRAAQGATPAAPTSATEGWGAPLKGGR